MTKKMVTQNIHEGKRRKYHQSEIGMFLKCGLQWEFRYEKGLVLPPKAALTVGSSVDGAVTTNLVQKVETGTDLPVEAVLDTFSTDFDIRSKETEWDEEDPGKAKDMGASLVKLHHEKLAPSIDPAAVQENFYIITDAGYDLGGTMDLVEKSDVIGDTKTSKGRYTDEDLDHGIQPTFYDFAFEAIRGRKAKAFRFDVLVKPTKTKPPEVQQIQKQITEQERQFLFQTIDSMHRAIQAGVVLPAAEGSWWCSKSWCGYWDKCKGRKS